MLNQPTQQFITMRPPDKFFPVGGCVTLRSQVGARRPAVCAPASCLVGAQEAGKRAAGGAAACGDAVRPALGPRPDPAPPLPPSARQANAGPLAVSSDLAATQDVCVQGTSAPWQQPADVVYTVSAAVDQSLAGSCQDGSIKTYTVGAPRRWADVCLYVCVCACVCVCTCVYVCVHLCMSFLCACA
jgi:hypothetical protein